MKQQQFTATLTTNLRDTLYDPKVLLLNLQSNGELFRDHCWTAISEQLQLAISKLSNNKPQSISFTAKPRKYHRTSDRLTISKLKDIQFI